MHGNLAQPTLQAQLDKQPQQGFAYLVVLFIAVALGLASTITYENYSTLAKREREAQWLFAGQQYQQALASYYHQSPNGLKSLPTKLDDLIKDSRFVSVKRHLRQLYIDPMTQDTWQLLLNDNQQIIGVVSASAEPILQSAKIAQLLPSAENIATYADLKFMFEAKANPAAPTEDVPSENAPSENLSQQESNDESLINEADQSDDSSEF